MGSNDTGFAGPITSQVTVTALKPGCTFQIVGRPSDNDLVKAYTQARRRRTHARIPLKVRSDSGHTFEKKLLLAFLDVGGKRLDFQGLIASGEDVEKLVGVFDNTGGEFTVLSH